MKLSKKYPLLAGRYRTMLNRCYNKATKSYENYGALGVTVCKAWLDTENGVDNYIKWALSELSYEDMKGLQIDKDIKSAKAGLKIPIYSPSTCSFVTRKENMKATKLLRKDNSSGYRGVHKTRGSTWVAEVRIDGKLVTLGNYKTPLEAAKAYDYYLVCIEDTDRTLNNVLASNEIISNISKYGYKSPIRKTSKLEFVHFERSRNKWKVLIPKNKPKGPKFVGRFNTEIEAKNARDKYLT